MQAFGLNRGAALCPTYHGDTEPTEAWQREGEDAYVTMDPADVLSFEQAKMRLRDLPDDTNEVSGAVLDAAMEVHRVLGPGLVETVYRDCLAHELRLRGFVVQHEVWLPAQYKDLGVQRAFRADLIVNERVVVEAKATSDLHPSMDAQLLTYLRSSGIRLGILLNFHARKIRGGGFKRLVL